MVGGAAGDALGYAVEFLSLQQIVQKYGEKGIRNFELNDNGVAEISDDTQMSLFTAEGLLTATVNGDFLEEDILKAICRGYECWFATQTRPAEIIEDSWLSHLSALWAARAPGGTCMSALRDICAGGPKSVINFSKGCGGVMRVAPIGIFAGANPEVLDFEFTRRIAGLAAELTHKHPLSSFSSMALALIVSECIQNEEIDREIFRAIIIDRVFKVLGKLFKGDDYLNSLFYLILKAMTLAETDKSDTECIGELGEGWVAEETLAIAVFSVMRYIDDFENCIVCAVNHSGDSDSTGAVAGNIIGSILGYEKIPHHFKTSLELHDVLISVAEDLCGVSNENRMKERYVNHRPSNSDPIQ